MQGATKVYPNDLPGEPRLVLASRSPRRHELLRRLGVDFDVRASDEPEVLSARLSPAENVIALARNKARSVASQLSDGVVVGADTIVVVDGKILGKPIDQEDAARMLSSLSGRSHLVYTAVATVDVPAGVVETGLVESRVTMKSLSDEEIERYVASGEPMDRAGSYAIQGLGGRLVESVEGCFNNVVGMPLCETRRLLLKAGFDFGPDGPVCRLPGGSTCPHEPADVTEY